MTAMNLKNVYVATMFLVFACPLWVYSADWDAFVPQMSPRLERGLADCKAKGISVYDMHIHLRGGMTAEKAVIRQEKTGIRSGVLENLGREWPLADNVQLKAFIDEAKRYPVLVGVQVNDRDWHIYYDKTQLDRLDFVLADTMIMGVTTEGKPQRLWLADYLVNDPDAWMEQYMEHNLRILDEPITILANPTYLPACIADQYDRLWTRERMLKIIDKAVEKGVALEIQAGSAFPKRTFLELARKRGAKFSLGTNNHDDKPIDMDRWFNVIEQLDWTSEQMFQPQSSK